MKFLNDSTAECIRGGSNGTAPGALQVAPITTINTPQVGSFQFSFTIKPSVAIDTITQLNTASNLVVFGGIVSNIKGIIASTQINLTP